MVLIEINHKKIVALSLAVTILFGWVSTVSAHCDRVNGPVAVAAKEALKSGDVSQVLIWVGEEQEEELRSKFKESMQVYRQGEPSRKLAERYFMETTVRLHREAEGMPYTGLKPASEVSEDIQLAEKALDSGKLKPVINLLSKELRQKTERLLSRAKKAETNKGNSIEAGRRWVDAYVKYIVYVHKLYQKIQAGPAHGVGNQ